MAIYEVVAGFWDLARGIFAFESERNFPKRIFHIQSVKKSKT